MGHQAASNDAEEAGVSDLESGKGRQREHEEQSQLQALGAQANLLLNSAQNALQLLTDIAICCPIPCCRLHSCKPSETSCLQSLMNKMMRLNALQLKMLL